MSQLIQVGKKLIERVGEDDVAGLSAQLAYFFLLSLFPFLLFLVTLFGYLNIDEQQFFSFVETYAPPETLDLITSNLAPILQEGNGGVLSIGIIGTLWAASNGVNAIIKAFNRAYRVDENRSFIVTRFIAIILTIAMFFVIVTAFLLPILGHSIGVFLFSFMGLSEGFIATWDALRFLISTVVFFIVLSFLFALAPNHKVRYKETLPGALFATLGWQGTSLLFSIYVDRIGNISATYGSLGAVIVLMIWFYLSGFVLIIGGELNAILRSHKRSEEQWL